MLVLAFFSWYYKEGWTATLHSSKKRVSRINRAFSVPLLLTTLFAPWRRIVTYPGSSLSDHLKAWADNLVSRAIGFVVRVCVLIAAMIMISTVMLLSLLELLIWPLVPPAIIGALVAGALL